MKHIDRERRLKSTGRHLPQRPRPIRLADVLVAILEKTREEGESWYYVDKYGAFGRMSKMHTYVSWNLRTDDLEQQSDETISFIASLV